MEFQKLHIQISNSWVHDYTCCTCPAGVDETDGCINLTALNGLLPTGFALKAQSAHFAHQVQFTCRQQHYLACENSCIMSSVPPEELSDKTTSDEVIGVLALKPEIFNREGVVN